MSEFGKDDGWRPATDRNLVAERRARLDEADRKAALRAAGVKAPRGRKTGDPRLDRMDPRERDARLADMLAR